MGDVFLANYLREVISSGDPLQTALAWDLLRLHTAIFLAEAKMFDLDKHFAVHASALRLSALRSELLARNLANADTPQYKATDIDFQKALSQALGESAAGTLRTTRSLHLAGANAAGDGVGGARVEFVERQPLTPSLDGNTVDVSMEQAEFAKNAIRYQASLNFLNSQMRGLMTAITGQ